MPTRRGAPLTGIGLVLIVLAAACGGGQRMPPLELPAFPGQTELAEAWELWDSQGLENYSFRVSGGSVWGGWGEFRVFVSGDDSSMREIEPPPNEYSRATWRMLGPVERLFALIESLPSEHLTVEYDQTWGYPTRLAYDSPVAVDEEWGMRVWRLEPFDGELPAHEIELATDRLRSRYSFSSVGVIVEATIGPVTGYVDEPVATGWIVTLEEPVVHFLDGDLDELIPEGSFEVYDYARGGPRTLKRCGVFDLRVLGWVSIASAYGCHSCRPVESVS